MPAPPKKLPPSFRDKVARPPKYVPDTPTIDDLWEEEVKEPLIGHPSPLPIDPDSGKPVNPEMPADITLLDTSAVSHLMGQMSLVSAHLEEHLALAESAAANSEARLKHLTAEVLLTKSGTVADKNSKALVDPGVVRLQREVLLLQAKARLLRARLRGYEKMAGALSRELSRRLTPEVHR